MGLHNVEMDRRVSKNTNEMMMDAMAVIEGNNYAKSGKRRVSLASVTRTFSKLALKIRGRSSKGSGLLPVADKVIEVSTPKKTEEAPRSRARSLSEPAPVVSKQPEVAYMDAAALEVFKCQPFSLLEKMTRFAWDLVIGEPPEDTPSAEARAQAAAAVAAETEEDDIPDDVSSASEESEIDDCRIIFEDPSNFRRECPSYQDHIRNAKRKTDV